MDHQNDCGLPAWLVAAALGFSEKPGNAGRSAEGGAFVPSCVGCRLRRELAELDAFVSLQATNAPPHHLYRLAAHLYATKIAPRISSASGAAAPEFPPEQIQTHYESCAFNLRLTVLGKLRELRGIREMLLASLRKATAEGRDAKATLSLYTQCCRHEREQYAMLQGLPPPQPHATPAAPPPRSALPPRSVPLSTAGPTRAPVEETKADDDAASVAETTRAIGGGDAATAQQALRGLLFETVQPCRPPSTTAQPTLKELTAGASTVDILERDHHESLQGFQAAKPVAGRRCHCRHRRGAACHFTMDRAFLKQLVGESGALRDHFADPTALRNAILSLLHLRPGPILTRSGYGAQSVFGFSLRAAKPPHLAVSQ